MRGTIRVNFMARTGLKRFRGSKSWKEGGLLLPKPFPMDFAGLGCEIRTRRSKLHHKAARCPDDQAPHGGFGRAEHPQHGAVDRTRKSSHRGRHLQAPAWRKGPQ